MANDEGTGNIFPSAGEDLGASTLAPETAQTLSPSYRLAYDDPDFMLRDDLRALRLQLELMKPELIQAEQCIQSTIVIFGSTRITDPDTAAERLALAETAARADPSDASLQSKLSIARRIMAKAHYYEEARRLAQIFTEANGKDGGHEMVVVTGGGPGIMEAANRGAFETGGKSIGLNIVLPREQCPNAYITPELCFQFHYFAIRKMHFLMRARALVAFPGGYGTLDELFETLTLIQTGKIKPVPVLLFGREYWNRIVDFDALAEEGTIDAGDLELFQYVETAEDAYQKIRSYWTGEASAAY